MVFQHLMKPNMHWIRNGCQTNAKGSWFAMCCLYDMLLFVHTLVSHLTGVVRCKYSATFPRSGPTLMRVDSGRCLGQSWGCRFCLFTSDQKQQTFAYIVFMTPQPPRKKTGFLAINWDQLLLSMKSWMERLLVPKSWYWGHCVQDAAHERTTQFEKPPVVCGMDYLE